MGILEKIVTFGELITILVFGWYAFWGIVR